MNQIVTIGCYVIGDIRCEAKYEDHGDYVIVFSTKEGSDLPISESQVKISKDMISFVK